jgi:multicomponent Na+:H+ antiporter subunit D
VIIVVALSSVLNAAYFLPIVYRGWFKERARPWPEGHSRGRLEIGLALLLPPLVTALLALAAGLLASAPFSPLSWARLIVAREYSL